MAKCGVDHVLEDTLEMEELANQAFLVGSVLAFKEYNAMTLSTASNVALVHLDMLEMGKDAKDEGDVKVALATQVRNPEPYDFIN